MKFLKVQTQKTPPPGQKLATFFWLRLDQIIRVQPILLPSGDIDKEQAQLTLVNVQQPVTVFFTEPGRNYDWLLSNVLDVVN